MLGLEGDHAAILAKVTFEGPLGSASTLATRPGIRPDVQVEVETAKQILANLFATAEYWVPDKPHPHDVQMAELAKKQVHERILIGVMHILDGPPHIIALDLDPEVNPSSTSMRLRPRRFGRSFGSTARFQALLISSASTPAFDDSLPRSIQMEREVEMPSQYQDHLAQRGEVQEQQAEAADIADLDAARNERRRPRPCNRRRRRRGLTSQNCRTR